MDPTDDVTYLNYLSDKNHGFLLHSSDDALGVQDPTLNNEPIFGDLDDGANSWTIGGLPVLLNGPIICEGETSDNLGTANVALAELEENDNSSISNVENSDVSLTYPIEISSNGFVTSNGLFLSNDVLLQLNLQNEEHDGSEFSVNTQNKNTTGILLNGNENIYEVNFEPRPKNNLECCSNVLGENITTCENVDVSSKEIIQLLNIDSNIVNTNKNVLNHNIENVKNISTKEIGHLLNINGNIVNINQSVSSHNNIENIKRNEKQFLDNIADLIETVVAYKCKKCMFLSASVDDTIDHIKSKSCIQREASKSLENGKIKMKSVLNSNQIDPSKKQLVYLCSECDSGYVTTSELKKHMMTEHKLTSGQNQIAEVESTNKNILAPDSKKQKYVNIVKMQTKASKKVKCSIKGCDIRFSSDENRLRHERCHVNNQKKQFKCPTCAKIFSMWRVCSLHLWKCHQVDIGLLTCSVCNEYKTWSPYKLVIHMSIHDDLRQYLCNECGKSFKQMTQLRNHQVLHLRNDETVPRWTTQQKCDVCGNFYADSKSLKKHIQGVHNKFKPYVCNICGHKTARKAMLDLHLRQHTGEKPYKCSLCKYQTGDHNSLRRHLMRHNGDTKYSCPHCDYVSIQSVTYRKHMFTKHPGLEGLFCCTFCSFQTVNEINYRTHLGTHERSLLIRDENQSKVIDKVVTSSAEETVSNDSMQLKQKASKMDVDDEETQHGFLSSIHADETVDTGGITIPAGLELQV